MDASWKVLPQKVKKGEEKRGIKEEQKMKIKERESGRESLSSQALPAASEAFPAACEALPAFTNLYKTFSLRLEVEYIGMKTIGKR